MVGDAQVIVVIPVKNEEERVGMCIDAISAQSRACNELLLLLNNCTDGTYDACRAANVAGNMNIVQCSLPPEIASAGEARRLALAHSLKICPNGIILTTDADAIPGPDWVAKNVTAIERGADVVCGKACLLPEDHKRIPPHLHHDEMLESLLLNLLDEIDTLIDHDPFDPWPRHQQNSGASIAMRARTLRQAGGAPHVRTGEDRALIARFQNMDARIRHDPTIVVPVSGRLDGRAENGMAATIKRRIGMRDEWTDERLEPAVDSYRRSLAKARLRGCWRDSGNLENVATDLLTKEEIILGALQTPYFGTAWQIVQAASPVLHRRRVAFDDIAREIEQAIQLRDMLRNDAADLAHHAGSFAVG